MDWWEVRTFDLILVQLHDASKFLVEHYLSQAIVLRRCISWAALKSDAGDQLTIWRAMAAVLQKALATCRAICFLSLIASSRHAVNVR